MGEVKSVDYSVNMELCGGLELSSVPEDAPSEDWQDEGIFVNGFPHHSHNSSLQLFIAYCHAL